MLKTQSQVRSAFWDECPPRFKRVKGWSQNQYPADVRMSWVDFVDSLEKSGQISERLAQRVTLSMHRTGADHDSNAD